MESDLPAEKPATPWPVAPTLDPSALLTELRSREQASHRAQQRLTALLDAVMAVTADLELADVLTRIVHSACELVDARYGALGVLGPMRMSYARTIPTVRYVAGLLSDLVNDTLVNE